MDDHNKRLTHEKLSQFMIDRINEWLLTSSDSLDESLFTILKQMGEFFDLDRIGLFLYDSAEMSFQLVMEWCHLGIEPRQQKVYRHQTSLKDQMYQTLRDGKPLNFESVDSDVVKQSWLKHLITDQIKAFYAKPLWTNDLFLGYISFENQRRSQSFHLMHDPIMTIFYHTLSLKLSNQFYVQDYQSNKEKSSEQQHKQYAFVANISHEIRTPLNGIHNALYLLQTTDITKEQKEYLDMAQTSMDQMTSIVDRVMDLDALESGQLDIQKRTFNLEDEMIRLIKMHSRQLEQKGLIFTWNYDYQINHEVIGDDRKLRHILSHLIQNAIKFTEQGSITFNVKKMDEKSYIFEIKDTGIGISEEHMTHLYDAFYQVDMTDEKAYQGLGIGLTVAHELTKLLSGKLSVESTLGYGSTFSLKLDLETGHDISFSQLHQLNMMVYHDHKPSKMMEMLSSMGIHVYDEEHKTSQKADIICFEIPLKQGETLHQIKEMYGRNETLLLTLGHMEQKRMKKVDGSLEYPISRTMLMQKLLSAMHEIRKSVTSMYTKTLKGTALIVDDNRLNRVALESILKKLGIQSVLVESGQSAIDYMKEHTVDLILMDIQMPHMDGLEATRRIRSLGQSCQSVPIVAVTANAYFNDYDLLKATQINDVIFKPIQIESLGQMLRKYMSTEETIHIPDEITRFDKNDFLKRFEGSYDIAKEVIDTFQVECPKDLEQIRKSIETHDSEQIIKAAHYYKGSCAYLSGKRLVWLLNQMMDDAKRLSFDHMEELHGLLVKETEELLSQLKQMHF
ncbi:MAG: hypothetical protein A3K26_04980 [Tenericutes bacterium RIFOXYA12_FULL_35_10]|nr:MAG: hypothetical protein A2Y44_00355 [Tenericutes bacterium GWF2_35_184]OHE43894.1 MAG: hypothetical protein A2221_10250 [Tenericutes bacterium RIFOXYA2_FULL_36_32]OHE46450.1 MAG: hypothetical protein A3K26_04980 [Tenericutes bacterium RIFOXYA12_FULL_35_10]OHE48657.1 MAG: hypothetical protein A2449_09070 [Tenericutes bacterium RIFOXYC2_FULL_35_27]OHE51454.1 MAG: hypothetical protein A2558_06150 [Tenericutes bacterium RIFOXYD2_FULL_35_11]OHE53783.1 MAG: hypothetical protein A2518_05150 [Ten